MIRTITINGVTYTLKYTLKSLFIFEELAGRPFNINKLMDWVLWFYTTLIANNKNFGLGFDDFVSLCDEHPELFNEFKKFITDWTKLEAQTAANQSGTDEVKKKTRPRLKRKS